jgi:hypothetical protein
MLARKIEIKPKNLKIPVERSVCRRASKSSFSAISLCSDCSRVILSNDQIQELVLLKRERK